MVCQKEIIKGTFNPRTYKVVSCVKVGDYFWCLQDDDPVNWAKKRKTEYLVPSGVINYTWEVTRNKEENKEENKEGNKEGEKEGDKEECREIIIVRKPCDKNKKRVVKMPSRDDIWPRRMRTDITEHYH